MSNPILQIQMGHVDPNASPLTVNELIDLQNTVLTGTIQGSYTPYVLQGGTPGVEDQDKAWIEQDSQGRPIGIKIFYGGNWRRVYNGMIGEIRGYSGNPGLSNDLGSDFDTNGHGQIGGRYDGWQLCNGKNGSPDMSNSFLVGANMNNATGTPPGWDGTGWQVWLGGFAEKSGGSPTATLTSANVPLPPLQQSKMDFYTIPGGGETSNAGGNLWGRNSAQHHPVPGGNPVDDAYVYPPAGYPAGRTGDPAPANFWTLPPYIALGWMVFQGY